MVRPFLPVSPVGGPSLLSLTFLPCSQLQQNDYYGRPPSYDAPPPRASAERSFDRAPRESRSYDRDDRRPSSYDRDERRSSPYEDGRMPRERYEVWPAS